MIDIIPTFAEMELPDLLSAINAEHCRAIRSARATVEHAVRCGAMLSAAKAKVSHGKWEAWLIENTEVSLRTSQRYMRLASNTTSMSFLDSDMGIAEALEMISAQKEPASPSSSPVRLSNKSTSTDKNEPLVVEAVIVESLSAEESPIEKTLAPLQRNDSTQKDNPWLASKSAISELEKIGDSDHSPLADVLFYIEKRWNISFSRKEGK